jgi:putative hydrolase of the HAD superfamily
VRNSRLSCPNGDRFEAIIFDMGSTLLEFENVPWPLLYPMSLDCLRRRLIDWERQPPSLDVIETKFHELLERRRAGIRSEMKEYRVSELLSSLLRSLNVEVKPGELSGLIDAYYAPIRRQVTAYPDSAPTLAALKKAGYRLALLSNTCFRVRDHREELKEHGLWDYFETRLFTSTGVYRKPHPAPFREVLERLGTPPERCVYVGDRQREDVLGPQALGMTAVLIRRPHRAYEQGLTDSVEIPSVGALQALLVP